MLNTLTEWIDWNFNGLEHFQSLILLFKCLKGQGPIYLKDFFKVRLAPYNRRGSGSKLEQPSFNSTWGKNSFCSITSRGCGTTYQTARNADNTRNTCTQQPPELPDGIS